MGKMSDAAKNAQREYLRSWRERNKEHIREYRRKWRAANKERVDEYCERYWERKSAKGVRNDAENEIDN